jgi:hypothetical protein
MDRRRFLLSSLAGALGVLVAPVLGGAQGTRKAPRVGVVLAATQALGQPSTEAFRAGLRDLGYLEGQSIAIEVRWAEGNPERFPDLIADLLKGVGPVHGIPLLTCNLKQSRHYKPAEMPTQTGSGRKTRRARAG